MKARLSRQAEADLEDILAWSETHLGEGAAMRYAELVIQALHDLETDPYRPSARHLPELQRDLFSYHLVHSRDRVVVTA